MKPGCKPKEPEPDRRSLSQARLDRIAHPTSNHYAAYLKWFARLSGDRKTYPSSEMKRYLQDELGPEIARLKRTVMFPPETMPAQEWEQAEDRLQSLQGRAAAIAAVLEIRSKQPAVSGGSGSPAASSSSNSAGPETDPFEQE